MSKEEKDLLEDCTGNCVERILTETTEGNPDSDESYYHLIMPMQDYVEYLDPDAFQDKSYEGIK